MLSVVSEFLVFLAIVCGLMVAAAFAAIVVVLAVGLLLAGSCYVLSPLFEYVREVNRAQARIVTPPLWGRIGREFGAWDWEYVWEGMQRRYYHDIPESNQRKRRHKHSAGLRGSASDKTRTESTRARKRKRRNK
jgi:hypothetical protein